MVKACRKLEKKTIGVMPYMAGEVWVEITELPSNNCPCYIILDAEGVEELMRDLRAVSSSGVFGA